MNGTLVIKGGTKLHGSVTPIPNKNAILPALPACILTDKPITYNNLPQTSDVLKMLEILKNLGAEVTKKNNSTVIQCANISGYKVDKLLGSSIRASLMFAGPLLARFGQTEIPLPGGCVLGARSIAAHVDAFSKVGITTKFDFDNDTVLFKVTKEIPKDHKIWLSEASVTATENLALYLAGCNNTVTVVNCACEPHVSQLLVLLTEMGAEVSGIGSNRIQIKGNSNLESAVFIPDFDFVDIAGFIVAAAVTRGRITIKGANNFDVIGAFVDVFKAFNIEIISSGSDLIVDGSNDLKIDIDTSGFPLASPDLPKLKPAPWPGFPVDILPVMATLACKMDGRLLLQNWMYETGLDFIRELNKMGANIFMSDPQRVIIQGPINFKGGEIVSPGIIQACKAIFLASLADNVTTTLHGANVLKRRYPDIVEVYKSLGADIEEVI